MSIINIKSTVRLFAAVLVTVATIGLSTLATPASKQTQNPPVTLKSIQTDRAATFYADKSPGCAWFREIVLATSDSKAAAENLKAVAATL
jgi:hypothetical protein